MIPSTVTVSADFNILKADKKLFVRDKSMKFWGSLAREKGRKKMHSKCLSWEDKSLTGKQNELTA